MRSGKGSIAPNNVQEEEEYEEDEFSAKKEGPSFNTTSNSQTNNANTNKDAKNVDKASAIRSKHSVTEQRRRSKINERFQILRDLIPHSDQKRDTASFLLEVINYVQLLQEKVQKYEGSFQGWNSEPTKLMPWRNSHWRVQSFVGHPQAIKNGSGSGPGSTYSGKLDDNNISISPTMLTTPHNLVESEASKVMDRQSEFANKGPLSMPLQANVPPVRSDGTSAHPLHRPVSDARLTDCTIGDFIGQQEDLVIEGGTISISSAYSHGLLNNLTHALQSAGVDLSQANISVQIDLGNRSNRGLTSETPVVKSHEDPPSNQTTSLMDAGCGEDQASKRLKT